MKQLVRLVAMLGVACAASCNRPAVTPAQANGTAPAVAIAAVVPQTIHVIPFYDYGKSGYQGLSAPAVTQALSAASPRSTVRPSWVGVRSARRRLTRVRAPGAVSFTASCQTRVSKRISASYCIRFKEPLRMERQRSRFCSQRRAATSMARRFTVANTTAGHSSNCIQPDPVIPKRSSTALVRTGRRLPDIGRD